MPDFERQIHVNLLMADLEKEKEALNNT